MTQPFGMPTIVATFCRFLLKTGRRIVYPYFAISSVALGVSVVAVTLLLTVNQVSNVSDSFRTGEMPGAFASRTRFITFLLSFCYVRGLEWSRRDLSPHDSRVCDQRHTQGTREAHHDTAIRNARYRRYLLPLSPTTGRHFVYRDNVYRANVSSSSAVFGVGSGVSIAGTARLWRILPPDTLIRTCGQPLRRRSAWRNLLRRPSAQTLQVYAFLASCASDIFTVVYGLWRVQSYNLMTHGLQLRSSLWASIHDIHLHDIPNYDIPNYDIPIYDIPIYDKEAVYYHAS